MDGSLGVVTETFQYDNAEVFELKLEDGITIKATGDHKFLISEYPRIGDLDDGEWTSVFDLVDLVKNTKCVNIHERVLEQK